jgi:hypothetical protein
MAVGERWVDEQLCDRGRVVRTEITVPAETQRTASGIEVRVVHRVVTEDGVPVSDTVGWYAQDTAGNVWHLGQQKVTRAAGRIVSTAGSWEVGVDGAAPHLVLARRPRAASGPSVQEPSTPRALLATRGAVGSRDDGIPSEGGPDAP